MTIAPRAGNSDPFFFVSDMYSVGEVKASINASCIDMIVSDPIPFNSTGNINPGSVVQYYRGDSAAIVLRGYEDAKEMPGNLSMVPNPPFPPNINMSGWACLNSTVGGSIPLMHGGSGLPPYKIALCVVLPSSFVLGICYYCIHKSIRNRTRR
jgi:hypothetical protein